MDFWLHLELLVLLPPPDGAGDVDSKLSPVHTRKPNRSYDATSQV